MHTIHVITCVSCLQTAVVTGNRGPDFREKKIYDEVVTIL